MKRKVQGRHYINAVFVCEILKTCLTVLQMRIVGRPIHLSGEGENKSRMVKVLRYYL